MVIRNLSKNYAIQLAVFPYIVTMAFLCFPRL